MSIGYYGYHTEAGEWYCEFCEFYCDSENWADIENHEDTCTHNPRYKQEAEPTKLGVMKVANFLRVSPTQTEQVSAFIQEDGNVVISSAWFHMLMAEAGWEKR